MKEITKKLNLIKNNPSFVIREDSSGDLNVETITEMPNDRDAYWLSARSILKNGIELDSVFIISGGGAEHLKIYWFVDGEWFESSDKNIPKKLKTPSSDIFPFDWEYSIKVANDIYHK